MRSAELDSPGQMVEDKADVNITEAGEGGNFYLNMRSQRLVKASVEISQSAMSELLPTDLLILLFV